MIQMVAVQPRRLLAQRVDKKAIGLSRRHGFDSVADQVHDRRAAYEQVPATAEAAVGALLVQRIVCGAPGRSEPPGKVVFPPDMLFPSDAEELDDRVADPSWRV